MYPSKVIFEHIKIINTENAGDLIEISFQEVYSPKHTLEELVAELEARMQSKINANPMQYLASETLFGFQPHHVLLKIEDPEKQTLQMVIKSKGKCLNFNTIIEYEEVHLVGFMDDKYMIAKTEVDLWNNFAEIIYIPKEPGLTIRKIQFLE